MNSSSCMQGEHAVIVQSQTDTNASARMTQQGVRAASVSMALWASVRFYMTHSCYLVLLMTASQTVSAKIGKPWINICIQKTKSSRCITSFSFLKTLLKDDLSQLTVVTLLQHPWTQMFINHYILYFYLPKSSFYSHLSSYTVLGLCDSLCNR